MTEEKRKLEQIGRTLEELHSKGKVSTTDPRHMTRRDVQAFMAEIKKLDSGVQSRTIKRLEGFLGFYKNHVIDDMRADGVIFPKASKKAIRVIEPEDLTAIFRTTDDLPGWTGSMARGMMALYFATGVRPSELRLAHFEDLNIKKGKLFVRHPKGEGSWSSPEWVDIIRGDMLPLIERYIKERGAYLQAHGTAKATALFPNLYEGQDGFYSANRFRMIKEKVAQASGVDFKLKDFRSTLTTMTVNGDPSRLSAMSCQLRHSTPATTTKFYNKVERGTAGKQLRNAWMENPVIEQKRPVIEKNFGMTGYG